MTELLRDEELAGGLKNAIERGQTLEQAKKSFLNAGYTPLEVESAVRKLKQQYPNIFTTPTPQQTPKKPLPEKKQIVEQQPKPAPKKIQPKTLPKQPPKKTPQQTPNQLPEDQEVYKQEKPFPTILLIALIFLLILIISGVVLLWMFWDKLF